MKKTLLIVALVGSLLSTPAFAWSDREQGILSGIAGYWLFNKMTERKETVVMPGNRAPGNFDYPSYGGAVPPPPVIWNYNCRTAIIEDYSSGRMIRTPVTICN